MATIVKAPSGTWKAVIRKLGWPTASKTFRTKRDAEDWSRRTEDEMVRGVFISRTPSERMTFGAALTRYLAEVTPLKRSTTQRSERVSAGHLNKFFGQYSLAALSSELVASYRDLRLGEGKSNNLYATAMGCANICDARAAALCYRADFELGRCMSLVFIKTIHQF